MTYYCGHCLFNKRRFVETKCVITGLAVVYICPDCKYSEPVTKVEALIELRKRFMQGARTQKIE